MYEIVVGRSESDRKDLGLAGTIYIGKMYVKMGAITSLSNKVYMDIARGHVVFIVGKRGTGKSYSMGVIAEEMANLPPEIGKRLAVLIVDTMGIYWTMKYGNEKDEDLLNEWDLPKRGLNVSIYTPKGYYDGYKESGIPTDHPFSIRPSELDSQDWAGAFGVSLLDNVGIAIERTVEKTKERYNDNYDIETLIKILNEDEKLTAEAKLALENRFITAKGWGLFDIEGTPLKKIIAGGQTTVLDISCYSNWTIKCLVLGIICRRLMLERMASRKVEELADVERGHSYFKTTIETKEDDTPIVWIMIDEAHEFLPKDYKTLSTDALVTILREGRQPGICLVLVSQQPGQIHTDVLTQTDIIIAHRITAKKDVEALNSMMQAYTSGDIQKYLNDLPTERGSAVILDDNSERMYPMRTHPRFTWHGGEAPTAIKAKGTSLTKLGL